MAEQELPRSRIVGWPMGAPVGVALEMMVDRMSLEGRVVAAPEEGLVVGFEWLRQGLRLDQKQKRSPAGLKSWRNANVHHLSPHLAGLLGAVDRERS